MYSSTLAQNSKLFAVAPMMDWTDRHCRYFHRLLSRHALLYTEMVVADALIHGDVPRHLDFDQCEHPVALQIGGSEPEKLVKAAKIGAQWGYDEINLNVGCPSDRVQSGAFGACLMQEPELVAQCVGAMKEAVDIPVTVKCRIGVDDQDPVPALDEMAKGIFAEGCDGLWVHARKAWLQGLSPKENRDVPPLNYDRVRHLKRDFSNHFIGINGGLDSLNQALPFLDELDGVMLGRAAYHNASLLLDVDRQVYQAKQVPITLEALCEAMMAYTAIHLARGGKAIHVTRHMIGLFHGKRGARRYRQILSIEACKPDADERVIEEAFQAVLNWDEVAA
ncbi:MAG: tRNA dihydrouridine(20/20a) synthase DusA [Rhizobiaceae bacterium]